MSQQDVLTEVSTLSLNQADPTAIVSEYTNAVNDLGTALYHTNASTLMFTEGTSTYTLPNQMLDMLALIWDDKHLDEMELRPLETYDPEWRNREGSPEAFTLEELSRKTIDLYPTPNVTSTTPVIPPTVLFGSSVFTTLGGALPTSLPTGAIEFYGGGHGNELWTNTAHTGNEALLIGSLVGGVICSVQTLTGLSFTSTGNEIFTAWFQVVDTSPSSIVFRLYDSGGTGWHSVYLGNNNFGIGTNIGTVPNTIGSWLSVTYTAAQLRLLPGMIITGIAFGVWATNSQVIFSDWTAPGVVPDPWGSNYLPYQGLVIFSETRTNVLPYLELPIAMKVLEQEFSRESNHTDPQLAQAAKLLGDVMFEAVK